MSYKGNPNLIRENTVREFTPEQLMEMYKCGSDIEYFSENYATIITLDAGKQPIKLYDYQKDMLKLMNGETIKDNKYNVITLAPRQCGKCCTGATLITVKNNMTKEILDITMEEFHEMVKMEAQ